MEREQKTQEKPPATTPRLVENRELSETELEAVKKISEEIQLKTNGLIYELGTAMIQHF